MSGNEEKCVLSKEKCFKGKPSSWAENLLETGTLGGVSFLERGKAVWVKKTKRRLVLCARTGLVNT